MQASHLLLLDVAFVSTGVAVWSCSDDAFVFLDCIKTERRSNAYVANDNVRRCAEIAERLRTITERFKPKVVFAELPHQGAKSAKALKSMALATGTIATFCAMMRLPLYPVQPLELKRIIGKGSVSKGQIIRHVCALFGNPFVGKKLLSKHPKREHIADAMIILEVVKKNYCNFLT